MLQISITGEKPPPYIVHFPCNGANIVSGLVMDYDAVQAIHFYQAHVVPVYEPKYELPGWNIYPICDQSLVLDLSKWNWSIHAIKLHLL